MKYSFQNTWNNSSTALVKSQVQHWTLQGKNNLGKTIEKKSKYIEGCCKEKRNEKVPATHWFLWQGTNLCNVEEEQKNFQRNLYNSSIYFPPNSEVNVKPYS